MTTRSVHGSRLAWTGLKTRKEKECRCLISLTSSGGIAAHCCPSSGSKYPARIISPNVRSIEVLRAAAVVRPWAMASATPCEKTYRRPSIKFQPRIQPSHWTCVSCCSRAAVGLQQLSIVGCCSIHTYLAAVEICPGIQPRRCACCDVLRLRRHPQRPAVRYYLLPSTDAVHTLISRQEQ